jgi:hypothetical protein
MLVYSFLPDPNFPNGTMIPGFGMDGGPGELLLDPNHVDIRLSAYGGPWLGPGNPISVFTDIPDRPRYVGRVFYAQGALWDPAATTGPKFGLTRGIQIQLGY